MVEICALASGSNGNCYYVGNEKNAVLIDAGVSCKQIMLRINQKGLNPSRIRAVFITHEHVDHVRGARVLNKKLNVPFYFTEKTYIHLHEKFQPNFVRFFTPGDSITFGNLMVHSFSKKHDGVDPCSFRVETNNRHVGIFTDIGTPCENLEKHISQCNAIFLEANYDEPMLTNGSYPYFLKQRVVSDNGHLSNEQASELVRNFGSKQLQHVFLSHLSAENNTPYLAQKAFNDLKRKIKIHLTSRETASDVIVL